MSMDRNILDQVSNFLPTFGVQGKQFLEQITACDVDGDSKADLMATLAANLQTTLDGTPDLPTLTTEVEAAILALQTGEIPIPE